MIILMSQWYHFNRSGGNSIYYHCGCMEFKLFVGIYFLLVMKFWQVGKNIILARQWGTETEGVLNPNLKNKYSIYLPTTNKQFQVSS